MPKNKGNILIIDDNEEVLTALKMYLSKHFDVIMTEKSPNLIPHKIEREEIDVIILDMNFSAGVNTGNEGIFWLREIIKRDPSIIVIMITAYGDVDLAVKAVKEGATDFITKPWDNKRILTTIRNAMKIRHSGQEITKLKEQKKHFTEKIDKSYPLLHGESAVMRELIITVGKVAKTDANVLILGENGTGKELIAREIYKQSKRKEEVFISVDLGSLSETLFESEMFGYTKGAYTDAKIDKAGRFELSSGGTLFLDEIGNLSLDLQSKLLTVIQNKEVSRLGSAKKIGLDFRLITATNKPLLDMVHEGNFREDLLYRVNTVQIELPPLRSRREDIPLLANGFLIEYKKKYQRTNLMISDEAIDKLQNYSWPGNVRELRHTVEKTVIMTDSDKLSPDDFFFPKTSKTVNLESNFNLDENEKDIIIRALNQYKSNMSQVARELGITRATLYRKLKKYDI